MENTNLKELPDNIDNADEHFIDLMYHEDFDMLCIV